MINNLMYLQLNSKSHKRFSPSMLLSTGPQPSLSSLPPTSQPPPKSSGAPLATPERTPPNKTINLYNYH